MTNYERSNMVYKMTYRVSERTRYDRARQEYRDRRLVPVLVSPLQYHPQPEPGLHRRRLAGVSRAERQAVCVQKRRWSVPCKAGSMRYAHLFTGPIPSDPQGPEGPLVCQRGPAPRLHRGAPGGGTGGDELLSFLEEDPFPVEEPATPRKEHPQAARKGPKKPPRRKTVPVR